MGQRHRYVLAVVVLFAVLSGTYVVLASDDHERVPPPSPDESHDAELVAQAVRHLHTEDYRLTSRLYWTNGTTDDVEHREPVTGAVQNSRQRATFAYPEDGQERYANRAVTWQRWEHTDWRKERTTGWDAGTINPLGDPDQIEAVDFERVEREESDETVVLRLSDDEAVAVLHDSFDAYENATLELGLDREHGHLVSATLEMPSDGANGTLRHELRFENHGTVSVDRPGDLGFDAEEWFLKRYYSVR